jgi:hypothetical protein
LLGPGNLSKRSSGPFSFPCHHNTTSPARMYAANAENRSSSPGAPVSERAFDALGAAQVLRVLDGKPAREGAPLSELVGSAATTPSAGVTCPGRRGPRARPRGAEPLRLARSPTPAPPPRQGPAGTSTDGFEVENFSENRARENAPAALVKKSERHSPSRPRNRILPVVGWIATYSSPPR